MMRTVLTVVVVVVIVMGLAIGGGYMFQRSLIYQPMSGPVGPASGTLSGGQDVTLHTSDGLRLSAWFFPAGGADAHDPEDPAVLVAPGNGGNRSLRAPLAEALTERGMSVLLLEYRGFGENEGNPTEDGLARDVRAAHDYLTGQAGVDQDRLLYFGESLGAGVVSELATQRAPAGMLLRSPFTDLADTASHHFPFLPVRTLLRERYPVTENVRALAGVPIRVVYGTQDSVVPAEQSREVAEVAGTEPTVVDGADHNDLVLLEGEELVETMAQLAERATG